MLFRRLLLKRRAGIPWVGLKHDTGWTWKVEMRRIFCIYVGEVEAARYIHAAQIKQSNNQTKHQPVK